LFGGLELQKGQPHAPLKSICLFVMALIIFYQDCNSDLVGQPASVSILIRIEAIVCMSWVRKAPGQFVIQVKVCCFVVDIIGKQYRETAKLSYIRKRITILPVKS
jgi:hypothetical protein